MKNLIINIGTKSKKAFKNKLSTKKKDKILKDYYQLIDKNRKLIISQNKKDIKNAIKKKIKSNLIQRLILDNRKISAVVNSIKKIVKLKDPTNKVLESGKGQTV